MDQGDRYNTNKPRYSLVSPVAIKMLVEVLEFGASKYSEHNWAKGMKWEKQTMDSLMRHVEAWRSGEDNDPETGLPHVAHIMCNAMFLCHFVGTNTGEDDRYFKERESNAGSTKAELPNWAYYSLGNNTVVPRGVSSVQENLRETPR